MSFLSKRIDKQLASYQQELIETHYREVENMYRQIRGWRHDYRNHIQTMKAYAAAGDWEAIKNYLDLLDTDLNTVDTVIKTGNAMTDAILNSKISLAKSKDIQVTADARIPVKLKTSEIDLCCIIGNLFDNAIDASMQLPADQRLIRVYMDMKGTQLYISFTNFTAGKKMAKVGGLFRTTKGEGHGFQLPFSGPFVVKPAESDTYWKHPFPTQKKAYILQTREEVDQVIGQIYEAGYEDSLILQDFIPGDDSYMRVVTNYSGADGKVRLMCVGHVLLEEHSGHAIGNHAVIITEPEPELCEKLKSFLEAIHFTGFSNFDIKFDQRDGKFKAFEINCRQGRSNYYVTGAGYNLAKYLVEDRIEGKPCELTVTKNRHLWWVIPKQVAYDYVNPKYHEEMRALDQAGASVNPLFYGPDNGLMHKLRILRGQRRYVGWYASCMEKVK